MAYYWSPFLHAHRLRLQVLAATSATECCSLCEDKLQGQIYVCESDDFRVHKSCAHLPPKIQHYLHPCPLFLHFEEADCLCDACFKDIEDDLLYSCKECNFSLDVHCSKDPAPEELQSPSGEGKKLLHFSHGHPMTIFEKSQGMFYDHNGSYLCRICGKPLSSGENDANVVGCNGCNFFVHGPCLGMLPQRIRHSLHQQCERDLILYAPLSKPAVSAESRTKADPDQALMFRCGHCRFNLCMPCWLSPKTVSECREPERDTNPRQKVCSVCGRICRAPSQETHSVDCSVSQPESLQGRPRHIQHISHTFQPLTLVDLPEMGIYPTRCSLCLGECGDYAFLCFLEECRLSLHPECASIKPTVMSTDHKHPLTVVDKMYDEGVQCSRCSKSCSNYTVLRCQVPRCNYTIHIWCGPLPCNIQHPVHVHPLALKEYLVNEDDQDEDDDEKSFCCHFCEKPRDPKLCVYSCEQGCNMICEVQCVASEVIATLRGQREDGVELWIVGKLYQGTCMILTDVETTSEEVKRVDTEDIVCPRFTYRQVLSIVGYHDGRREPIHLSPYSRTLGSSKDMTNSVLLEEACAQLVRSLQSHDITDDTVPERLARFIAAAVMDSSALEGARTCAMESHPDAVDRILTASIGEETAVISSLFTTELIQGMITTKVEDIDEGTLREWWGYLNWMKQAGVDMDFMFDPLERLTRAYFGLRAIRLVAEKERELEEITKEIDRLRIKAEAVKEEREICRMSMRNQTPFVKQCLKDARCLRWKPAFKAMRTDWNPSPCKGSGSRRS